MLKWFRQNFGRLRPSLGRARQKRWIWVSAEGGAGFDLCFGLSSTKSGLVATDAGLEAPGAILRRGRPEQTPDGHTTCDNNRSMPNARKIPSTRDCFAVGSPNVKFRLGRAWGASTLHVIPTHNR